MRKLVVLIGVLYLVSCQEAQGTVQAEGVESTIDPDTADVASIPTVQEEMTYQKYCNERFEFCFEYPSDFEGQGQSQNGDGQSFKSEDKKTEITFYGSNYMDEFNTVETNYDFALKEYGKVTYKTLKDSYFVVSGTVNEKGEEFIFYRKTIHSYKEGSIEALLTIEIKYPSSQKQRYNAYCKKIDQDLQ